MKVAVVILNWNGIKYLSRFLPSVVKSVENIPDSKVIVADNHSTDDSVRLLKSDFPSVRIIELDRNYGFASGYNRSLTQVKADYFVLLNSDVLVPDNWLSPLFSFMESNPDVAACQPKLLSYHKRDSFEYAGAAGGFIDYLGYPFCRGRIFSSVETDHGQYDDVANIFWATGACLMIRSSVWHKVGGLDDSFFAHMEEIDLCWRLHNRGYLVSCVPSSVVYHVGGGTLATGSPMKTKLNFRNNLIMLYKNLPDSSLFRILFMRMILDGIAALSFLLKGEVKNMIAVYHAHCEFRKLKPSLKDKRNKEQIALSSNTGNTLHPIFRRSILVLYYLRHMKTFVNLKWNFK